MIVNGELEGMCKKAAVAYFKTVSSMCMEEFRKATKSHNRRPLCRKSNPETPGYKAYNTTIKFGQYTLLSYCTARGKLFELYLMFSQHYPTV
jgi:hypothetical protein